MGRSYLGRHQRIKLFALPNCFPTATESIRILDSQPLERMPEVGILLVRQVLERKTSPVLLIPILYKPFLLCVFS